jgi:hypothetical protein
MAETTGPTRWTGSRVDVPVVGHHGAVEVVSVVAAVVSGLFALATLYLTRRAALKDRLQAADETALHYRIPLLAAASDLQARLYNIRKQDFLTRFPVKMANRAQPEYAVENTLYLIGQYLCYAEAIRRGALYLDPVDLQRQKAMIEQIEKIRDIFSSSTITEPALCLFRGEQRAVAEVMLVPTDGAPGKSSGWDCIGYAAFVEALKDTDKARWFDHLREDIAELQTDLGGHDVRLIELQNSLVDLVDLIDPAGEHVSTALRNKL